MSFTEQSGPEALSTQGALEGLDVDYHVAAQASVGGERSFANVTLKWFHSCQGEMTEERDFCTFY